MDFDLSEEQRMLKASVERLVGERYDFESRKRYLKAPEGFSPAKVIDAAGCVGPTRRWACSDCRSRNVTAAAAAARSKR